MQLSESSGFSSQLSSYYFIPVLKTTVGRWPFSNQFLTLISIVAILQSHLSSYVRIIDSMHKLLT